MSNMSSEAYVANFELFNSLCQQQQLHNKSATRILKPNLTNMNLKELVLLPNRNIRLANFARVVPGNIRLPGVKNVHAQNLTISSRNVRSPDQRIFGTPVAIQLPKATATFSNSSNVSTASQLVARHRKDMLSATINYELDLDEDGLFRSVDSNGSDMDSDEVTVIEEETEANEEYSLKITNTATVTPQPIRKIKASKPGHIKRPLNAFMAFSKTARRRVMDEDPSMHHAAVSKRLGAVWKALTPEQKKPYYDEAKQLADEHLRQYPGYKYKPKPKKAKAEEAAMNAPSPHLAAQIAATTARAEETARAVGSIKDEEYIKEEDLVNIKPAGRISPSSFHAWSLIYESEEEEDDGDEEMEDID